MTSVAVILATYNGARFLPRQLESLAWQSRLPDQLVITDDGSSDETVAIAERFAREAAFAVRVVTNPRPGSYARNFMSGVAQSSADLVMFCDQDDIWRPDKIAVMADFLDANPHVLLAYHHGTVVDADERPIGPISDPAEQRAILASAVPPPWHFARGLLQVFRRELTRFDDLWPMSRNHFNDEVLAHDRWYFSLAEALGGLAFVERDLLSYRQHGSNAYGADRAQGRFARIASRLHHVAASDAYASAAAASLASVFSAVGARVDGEQRARVERFAERYRAYGDRLARRHDTFTAAGLTSRARALFRSVARGDYHGNPWGFDPRSVARDAWLGVLNGG